MLPLFVILGVAALVTYAGVSAAKSAPSSPPPGAPWLWPPTAQDQTRLTSELAFWQLRANGGAPLSAAQQTAIANFVASAPSTYMAQLTSGQAASVVDYESWAIALYITSQTQTLPTPAAFPPAGTYGLGADVPLSPASHASAGYILDSYWTDAHGRVFIRDGWGRVFQVNG